MELKLMFLKDIKLWPDGDCSLLGETEMNLSGGQKQRIQLARAVYSDADVYFLDDPFSVVDAYTETHLFNVSIILLLFFLSVSFYDLLLLH
uniref:ABC transporter domain-containing protein n=1 Tax=Cucumis melo TaxID=3656 RepID=A0A9I9D253_CUCME